MRKYKILSVIRQSFPPKFSDISVLFGQQFASNGHTLDWVLQSEEPCPSSYSVRWGGGTAHVGPRSAGDGVLAKMRRHMQGFIHALRVFRLAQHDYDLIQAKDIFFRGCLCLLAAKCSRKKFVFWLSYPFPEHYLDEARNGLARYPFASSCKGQLSSVLLYRILLPGADHILVQSEQMKKDIASHGILADKITPIRMGVAQVQDIPPEPDPATGKTVVYLGTLARIRRLDFLVRVMDRVILKEPSARLIVLGKGESPDDEKLITDEIRRLGLEDAIELMGFMPFDRAMEHVRQASVCVSPYRPCFVLNSTSPTKLIEYMAAGKAVVANDHPEQKLVIEMSGGGLVVPYSEDDFADAIVTLLRNPDLAQEMGMKGREYVLKNRTYSMISKSLETLYSSLLN